MKRSVWLATALALLVATGAAQAHTRLMKAAPADGSVIDALPEAIELHFSEATRISLRTIADQSLPASDQLSCNTAQPPRVRASQREAHSPRLNFDEIFFAEI